MKTFFILILIILFIVSGIYFVYKRSIKDIGENSAFAADQAQALLCLKKQLTAIILKISI